MFITYVLRIKEYVLIYLNVIKILHAVDMIIMIRMPMLEKFEIDFGSVSSNL